MARAVQGAKHQELAPDRTPAEHDPVMARAVQGAKHQELAPDRTPAEHDPVMARAVQGAKHQELAPDRTPAELAPVMARAVQGAKHQELAPDRTPAELAPVMARAVQGVKQDPTRPSSRGRSRTKGLTRARRTREVERVLLTAGPRRGLVRAASAQGLVLGEPGGTRESLFCRTSKRPVTGQAVLIQEVLRGGSRQRHPAPLVRTARRFSTGRKVPEVDLAVPSRPRPGRRLAWPGPATPIPSDHQGPATCRRLALPRILDCRA